MNKIILMIIILSMAGDVFAYSRSRDHDEKLVSRACHLYPTLYPNLWGQRDGQRVHQRRIEYQCRRMTEAVMQRIRETTDNEQRHVESDDPYEKSPIYYEPRKLSAAMATICTYNDVNTRDERVRMLYSHMPSKNYMIRMKQADIPSYRNYENDLYDMVCGVRDIPGFAIMGSYSQCYTRRSMFYVNHKYRYGLERVNLYIPVITLYPSATVAPKLWKQIGNYQIVGRIYDCFGAPDNMKNYHIRNMSGLTYMILTQQSLSIKPYWEAWNYAIRYDKWIYLSSRKKYKRTPAGTVITQKYIANNGQITQADITVKNNRLIYAHIKDRLFKKYGVPLYFSPCDWGFNKCRESITWNVRKKAKFLFGTGKPQYFISQIRLQFCGGFIILRESVNSGNQKAYDNQFESNFKFGYPLQNEFYGPETQDLRVVSFTKLYPHLTLKQYHDKVNGEWMKYKRNIR